ncbi:helix-turn-helix transcriptional regulator [Pseudodonghicola flavimaris]|uniref:AraC family transcriptional regulator n=1 Tax=Pseudodonghicola flavimaris TaxID=3050036 RepID=A0ABT7EVR5_9RHOB|nr:AraC family transcriptional regulator [Pseudodonghicola flavimaris]MDK3016434.1 AraC family transcriptional regulator [Pseudodonghicola flavimaris]
MDQRVTEAPAATAALPEVRLLPITQATAVTFTDLYLRLALLVFVQTGTKRVVCPRNGELIGAAGDLMIFPPGSFVTLENRPVLNDSYRATGLCLSHDLIDAVFAGCGAERRAPGIQLLRAKPDRPAEMLDLIRETLSNPALPPEIRSHRLLEPLIWLRGHGVHLPRLEQDAPLNRVRGLIETDPAHPWRIGEVAAHLAMSEATLRRRLTEAGQGFARLLLNTRLELGLSLLQTTERPISDVALDCGFKTPSHFSDAFRHRFGIRPRAIRTAAV